MHNSKTSAYPLASNTHKSLNMNLQPLAIAHNIATIFILGNGLISIFKERGFKQRDQ